MTTLLSFDGQPLKLDDIVYQLAFTELFDVELTAFKITQILNEGKNLIRILDNQLQEKITTSSNVCKDPLFLVNDWIEQARDLLENKIPKRIENLQKLRSEIIENPIKISFVEIKEGLNEEELL